MKRRRQNRKPHHSARRQKKHFRSLRLESLEHRCLLTTIDLGSLGSAGVTMYGADPLDESGSVSTVGDVNGDGFDDFLIGAQRADAAGNAKNHAGESYLIFGGLALPASIDLANLGSAGIIFHGADAEDSSGVSISDAGDVNGDGFDDWLIGAQIGRGEGNLNPYSGETYLIFGKADWSATPTVDLGSLGSAGVTFFGVDTYDESGSRVSSAGDINGDGFDDLLIGTYLAAGAGNLEPYAGESYLIFGKADWSATPTIDLAGLGSAGVTFYGAEVGDFSNYSLSSAGDVNGDGFGDLLIGARDADAAGNLKNRAGETYLIFGKSDWSATPTIDLGSLGLAGIVFYGADAEDVSGFSLSDAGDVNGDGFDDLLIGAFRADAAGNLKNSAGDSYVVFGKADWSGTPTIDLASLGSAGITIYGADANDYSGRSAVSGAGDVNGDGFDDLLIGAQAADAAGNLKSGAGDSYVIFGKSDWSATPTIDLGNLGTAGITIYGVDVLDLSGRSVSNAGDVDGDGFDDLLISAYKADAAGNLKNASGESYLIFGGDFTASVTHLGTGVSETLSGDAAANVMIGGLGDDVLVGSGGPDVLRGGQGDDILAIGDLTFRRLVGGNGLDTLRLDTSDTMLDLTALADNRILGIEQIDLSGSGANTLVLDVAEVLNISDESNTLVVFGDATDGVITGSGWTSSPNENIGGTDFKVLTQGAATLKVAVPVRTLSHKTIDLANLGEAGLTAYGAEAGDHSGWWVSSGGDVNGDGFDDFLIGAERADSAGNLKNRAGDSYLIFGGPALPTSIDLANLGSAGVVFYGADEEDFSGFSLSDAGDVNGDGFDDLVIGAFLADAAGNLKFYAGDTYLIFGKADWSATPTVDLASLGSAGVTIYGIDEYDESGFPVSSAGDINGDGFDDLLIGAYLADAAGEAKSYAGESYVIFGKADWSTTPTIDLASLGSAGITLYGADADDFSGYSLSGAGDVNGDGFDDLLIGAWSGDAAGNSKNRAGDSYVIFGKADWSATPTIDLSNLGSAGVAIYGADVYDFSGFSVSSAGDVNGDGFDDLLIGASRADAADNLKNGAGDSYVIFGKSDWSSTPTVDLANLGTAGITLYGAEAVDKSGRSVSGAGDVNGDGFDDLLIGAVQASAAGNLKPAAGESYLVFGGPALPTSIDLGNLNFAGITIYGVDAGDVSGHSVSNAGDVNGDGFDDLLIGAYRGGAAGNLKNRAGESYLIFGGDFTAAVTHQGTAVSETLGGNAAANVMVGGLGDDVLVGSGGPDVLRGGQGDDILAIGDLTFSRLVGGNGLDTLRLDTSGTTLDLTALADNRILGVEQIDLSGSGANTLVLDVAEVLNISDESNTLVVFGDADDGVITGSGWTSSPNENIGGTDFKVLTQGAATLKVADGVSVLTNAPIESPLLVTTIEGIDFYENASNDGFYHIPPDPIGAVGLDHVVSVVNTSIEWHTKSGAQQNSQSLQSFFASLSPVNSTFDPKVIYDQYAGRFLVVTLEQQDTADGDSVNSSRLLLAVSDDSDPNGLWYFHAIDSRVTIGGVDEWADYPGFAVDEQVIYLTANMFSFGANLFGGARLWIIDKTDFYSGGAASVAVHDPSAAAGASAATTQPAHMFGTAQAGLGTFLVRSGFSDGTNEFLSIIRVEDPLAPSPTFTHQFVDVGDIDDMTVSMPNAPQAGSLELIETNDRRSLHAVWRDNALWAASTIVPSSGPDAGQATAHWFKIDTSNLGSLSLADQGNAGGNDVDPGAHTFFPSIAVDKDGNMAMGFALSSPNHYAGAYYTGRLASDPAGTVRQTGVLAAGLGPYVRTFGGSRNRWGDYSGISLDPVDESTFWVYNEYAIMPGNSTGEGDDGQWGTRFGSFSFLVPVVDVPAGGGTVDVSASGGELVVRQGTTELFRDALSSMSGVAIIGSTDSETFEINIDGLSAADLPSGIWLTGGEGLGDNDTLAVSGSVIVTNYQYTTGGPESGTISLDGLKVFFAEFEPIIDNLSVVNRVFSIGPNDGQTVRIADDGLPGNGMSIIDSGGTGGFESITFSAPIVSLAVIGGGGNDSITIESLDSAFSSTSLIISAGDGDDTIVVESLGSGFFGALTLDGGSGNDIATVSETVTTPVTVSHVAPIVNIGASAAIPEGDVFTLQGSFSDPDADTWTATVDYGDGSGEKTLALNLGKTFSLSHPYADDGQYTVVVTVTDDDGGIGAATFDMTVTNVAPAVNSLVFDSTVIDENGSVTLTGTFTDPGARDDHEVVIDWADGTSDTISNKRTFFDGTFDDTAWVEHVVQYGSGGSATAQQQTSGADTFRGIDISLSQAPAGGISQVGVYSILPSAAYDPAAEGEIFALDFQLSGVELPSTDVDFSFKAALRQGGQYYSTRHFALESPGQERTFTETDFVLEGQANVHPDFSASGSPIEFGFVAGAIIFDGSPAVSVGGGFDDWTLTVHRKMRSFTATHQYLDDNPTGTASDVYGIGLTVTDDDGGVGTATAAVTLNNVAPHDVVISDSLISTHVLAVGESALFDGSFADVGTMDTHTAEWSFSHVVGLSTETETRTGAVTQEIGGGTVTDSFSFPDPGVYTVTLTITDDDTGLTTSAESMFVVYDPSEGFVTGGGWIISPGGAYTADPTLTGKANFGFVSKYKKGATTPTGQTEFQFKVAHFNFHSTSYQWLVVAGARAQYKGQGTVNGAGNYGFMLTVIDGQVNGGGGVDKFRIKIWDKDVGDAETAGALVYDNGLGADDDDAPPTALGGGRIVIHQRPNALNVDNPLSGGSPGGKMLSQAMLSPVVNQAISQWAAAGVSSARLDTLSQIDVQLAELSGSLLGMASSSDVIWIDRDAAGYGWGGAGIDLLSVVSHELGHRLGFDHDLMGETLAVGTRQLASASLLLRSVSINDAHHSTGRPAANAGATNEVAENTPAGTEVGITASSTDVDNGAVIAYSLTDDAGGRFSIDSVSGVVTVANDSLLDYETATSHTIKIRATDEHGAMSSEVECTINVLNEANVTGFVFADVDNDGVFDVEDAPLAHVEITLTEAGVDELFGTADDETFTTMTDNDGFYGFEDIAAGKVRINESGPPADLTDGVDTPNGVNDLDAVNDQFTIDFGRTDVTDMNFAEQADGGGLNSGDTATIGYWHNKNGQALIEKLDEDGALTAWLLDNFGNIFDQDDFDEHGGSVGDFYRDEFFKKKLKGTPKVDAQFMAVAFAVFATSSNLSNGGAADFGFNVTDSGIGTTVVNVGSSGAAFDVDDNTDMTILALLRASDELTVAGADLIYDDGNNVLSDAEKVLRLLANIIYTDINEGGDL